MAQVFDFTINGDKIWFSEWVENNIGVIDTSIPLPFDIKLKQSSVSLGTGDSVTVTYEIIPKTDEEIFPVFLNFADTHDFIEMEPSQKYSDIFSLSPGEPKQIQITVNVDEPSIPGNYKLLVGAQTEDVAISKYITLEITQ